MFALLSLTAEVQTAPAPAGVSLSTDYEVWVNDEPVAVYSSAASPFAAFSFSGRVTVRVRKAGTRWTRIRPEHADLPWSLEEDALVVTLAEPGNLVFEGAAGEELYLFANAVETDIPDPADPGVIYFGPGIHYPGVIEVASGQSVYIAAGAVVHGQIKDAAGAPWAAQGVAVDAMILPHPRPFVSNIKIHGRGILSGETVERGSGTAADPYGMMIDLYGATGVVIEGIIIDNPAYWVVVPRMCDNLVIDNLKVIGTRINNDAVQIRNCSNVHIKGGFLRTNDDAIAIKGFNVCNRKSNRNILVEGTVIYNREGGQALEIGHSTKCAYITDITFRNLDILDSNYEALSIHSVDAAHIRNIRYEDIRIEKAERFIEFVVTTSKYSDDPSGNWIHGILIKDVVSPVNTVDIEADYVVFDNVSAVDTLVKGPNSLSGDCGPNTHYAWPDGPSAPPDPEPVPAPDIAGNLLLHQQAWRAENGRNASDPPWNLAAGDHSEAAPFSVPGPYPRWVEVDLEADHPLCRIQLKPYAGRAYQYRVHVRADGGKWRTVVDRSSNTVGDGILVDSFPPVMARFIRVEVTGAHGYRGSWISLNELRAYAQPAEERRLPGK